ncbi:hypothetical protein [Edaphobacter modestus]|uniref:Uncharacterized protein n=1 Tax=Edaphobacter modestus TaxID=388466 RepID=A0A4Q7YYL0_9BACT|nr:hypothetical protein [Edaphobacter modestus]RZU43072.1 hypothetical protein BDD14_4690 [Edaphobacter modestus]
MIESITVQSVATYSSISPQTMATLAVAQPATMFAPDWTKPAAVLVYNDVNHDSLGFDRMFPDLSGVLESHFARWV